MRMKKRVLSILLAFCLFVGLLPMTATAVPAGNSFQVSTTEAQVGDTLTVSFTQPISQTVSTLSLKISFDKTCFEVQSIANAPYADLQPSIDGANNNGYVQIGYTDNSLEANTDIAADTVLLSITFLVKNTATLGDKTFTVSNYEVGGAYNPSTYAMDDITPSDLDIGDKTKTVTIYEQLDALTVGITAPVKGDAPVTALDETEYAGSIGWSGAPATFAPNTVYTANVTLNAKAGYTFGPSIAVTVPGSTNVDIQPSSSTVLVFEAAFPATAAATLTELTITTPPSSTTYSHGDAFDNSGMVVRATYDDSSTDDDFTGYTVEYAAPGQTFLKYGDTSVTVKCGAVSTTQAVTVNKKNLTVTGLSATPREYDGTTAVTLSGGALSGVAPGDTVTATMPTSGTIGDANAENNKAVTFSSIALSGTDSGNYTISQPTVTVNIGKADPTAAHFDISAPVNKTYDGAAATVASPALKAAYESTGLDLTIFYNGVSQGTPPSKVGTYTVTFDIPNGGTNFNSSATAMDIGTLVISPKDVTITGVTAVGKTFDDSADATPGGTPVVSGALGGDTVTINAGTAVFDDKYAGTGKTVTFSGYSLSGADAGNYNLASQPANVTADITAADQAPTITAAANLAKGGNDLDLSTLVSGAQGAVSFSISSNATDATLLGSTLTSGTTQGDVVINVNAAAVDLNSDSMNEYNSFTANDAITVTIVNKADASVTIDGAATIAKTYGDSGFTLTASAANEGTNGAWSWASGDDTVATVDALGNVTITGQGSTTITATYESDTTLGNASVTLNVSRKDVTITGVTASGKTYDGTTTATADNSSAVVNGKVGSDDVTVSAGTADFSDKNVGTGKTVTFSGYTLTGAKAGNYNLTSQPANVTADITPKDVTATVTATDRDYAAGNTAVALVAGSVTGAEALDDVSVDVSSAQGTIADENAGADKAVTVTGVSLSGTDASNYNLASQPTGVTVTINKIAYTGSTSAAGSAKYGSSGTVDLSAYVVAGGTAAIDSFSDTNNVLNGLASITGTTMNFTFVNDALKVGCTASFTVQVTSTNYNNYNVTVTLTVLDKLPQTNFQFASATIPKTYGDAPFTIAATGAEAGSTVTYESSAPAVATVDNNGAVTILKAGDTTITATASETADYTGASANYTLNVSKATITVTAMNQSVYVNGVAPDLSTPVLNTHYTVTGLAGSDALSGTIALEYQQGGVAAVPDTSATGTYDIVASGVTADSEKYNDVVFADGLLTISTAPSGSGTVLVPFPVKVDPTQNGAVTVNPTSANVGETVTITVTPDEGYVLKSLTAGNAALTKVSDTVYTFSMPASAVSIAAEFEEEPAAPPVEVLFEDVDESDYYYDAVKWAVENEITTGTSETTFSPESSCSRAQMVTFLWRAAGSPEPTTSSNPFGDIDESEYYYKAVLWAAENGITQGTSAGSFSPDDTVSRDQSVTFLYRLAGNKSDTSNPFTDVDEDSFCYDAVVWALENGITTGTSATTFDPSADCLRGQIVTFLYRTYGQGK